MVLYQKYGNGMEEKTVFLHLHLIHSHSGRYNEGNFCILRSMCPLDNFDVGTDCLDNSVPHVCVMGAGITDGVAL